MRTRIDQVDNAAYPARLTDNPNIFPSTDVPPKDVSAWLKTVRQFDRNWYCDPTYLLALVEEFALPGLTTWLSGSPLMAEYGILICSTPRRRRMR